MPKDKKRSHQCYSSIYDIPDTSKGDFYCMLCDCHMNSFQVWQSHQAGKRHNTNKKKGPGKTPRVKTVSIEEDPLIMDLLEEETEPIVGLNFIFETRYADTTVKTFPFYSCTICGTTCSQMFIIEHLISLKHRLAYLKKTDPTSTLIMMNSGHSKKKHNIMIRNECKKIEKKFGRGKMDVRVKKFHGQVIPGARLKIKPAPLSIIPLLKNSEFQDFPARSYCMPTASHCGQPSLMCPLPVSCYFGQAPYRPSTSYTFNPSPPMGPMDETISDEIKPKKSKDLPEYSMTVPAASSKSGRHDSKLSEEINSDGTLDVMQVRRPA